MGNPLPSRDSIRLAGYDYSLAGVYFVTICAFRKAMRFGAIHDAKMMPSEVGAMVEAAWRDQLNRFPSLELDAFALMPNHLHGIIVLHQSRRAETSSAPTTERPSLARVVQSLKSTAYTRVRRQLGRAEPLWQRGYYEHIVRSGDALKAIQQYIRENPGRSEFDRENPRAARRPNPCAERWEV